MVFCILQATRKKIAKEKKNILMVVLNIIYVR